MMCSILLSMMALLLLHYSFQKGVNGLAPRGCSYEDGFARCDFQNWIPPLLDKDFGPGPVTSLMLHSIKRNIPLGAFSGLNGPPTKEVTPSITLDCDSGETSLTPDILTPNLYWVTRLEIHDCYLENGLPSRLLENLKNLEFLLIEGGTVGLVANDSFADLTSLQVIEFNSEITNGRLSAGLFDGLTNLTYIALSDAGLNSVPPNWFDGLVSLEKISLSNNNLQTLPAGLFNELRSLTIVELSNNPWNCSCGLRWFLEYIADVNCKYPSEFQNKGLEGVIRELDCPSATPTILSASLSSVLQTTEIPMTSAFTFSGSVFSIVTFSQIEEIFSTQVTSTAIPMISTDSKTTKTTALTPGIVVASVFGGLTLQFVVATIIYRLVCRNMCFGSVARVSSDEVERDAGDTQSMAIEQSMSTARP